MREDIISKLWNSGFSPLTYLIMENLDPVDLESTQAVCKKWHSIVNHFLDHFEAKAATRTDSYNEYFARQAKKLECTKDRSVTTVSTLFADNAAIIVGLGTSGRIEHFDRRTLKKSWSILGHEGGVYTVDSNRHLNILVSGGEDNMVKIWNREDGENISILHHHDFMVWIVKLFYEEEELTMVTAGYDCKIAFLKLENQREKSFTLEKVIQGPSQWSDGLALSGNGSFLASQFGENQSEIQIWNIEQVAKLNLEEVVPESCDDIRPDFSLRGHESEVHCVCFKESLDVIASAGEDKTVRLWSMDSGEAVAVLTIDSCDIGKIWSLDLDTRRIVAGCRRGIVCVWDIWRFRDEEKDWTDRGKAVKFLHSESTAVGVVKLSRLALISADGLGIISVANFI